MYVACEQCRKKVSDRNRMLIYANRTFCCIDCKEEYDEDQRRMLESQLPLPFDNIGWRDE